MTDRHGVIPIHEVCARCGRRPPPGQKLWVMTAHLTPRGGPGRLALQVCARCLPDPDPPKPAA
jgi:hypothetical protein